MLHEVYLHKNYRWKGEDWFSRGEVTYTSSLFFILLIVKGNRKCELNCQATGYRFYVRQAEKVIDGTPCDQNGTAICVSGQCKVSATGLGSLWCGYVTCD